MDSDVTRFRKRADHLLAIALRAREHGQTTVAEELLQLAAEVLDRAADIEHGDASVTAKRGIG